MAMSLSRPNMDRERGRSKTEPPVIPEAPQAPRDAKTLTMIAPDKLTSIPNVFTAVNVKTVIVTADPQSDSLELQTADKNADDGSDADA